MRKLSFRKIMAVANSEYQRFILNPRNIVILAMFVVLYDSILLEFFKMSEKMGEPINIFEPFMALCGTNLATMLLPIVFMIIISDFPKIQGNVRFYIVRTGKLNWLLGQLIFAFESAFTYMLSILLFTYIFSYPMSYTGDNWSNVVTRYYISFPEEVDSVANNLINATLYNQVTVSNAVIYTFTLFLLFLTLMGFIQMVAFVMSARKVGMFITCGFIIIGEAFAYVGGESMWYFPIAHIMTWRHYQEVLKEMYCEMSTSYLYFGALILVATILIFIFLRNKNFDEIEE